MKSNGKNGFIKLLKRVSALSRLACAEIAAIVLDYDGTLCDARHRFEPSRDKIAAALARLAENGIPIGVATGRRDSAGNAPGRLYRDRPQIDRDPQGTAGQVAFEEERR